MTRVLEDSSGNGGAAIAAYAAAGGIAAKISSRPPHRRQDGADARLRRRDRADSWNRQDVSDAAVRQAATIFYAGHNWQPFFLQGRRRWPMSFGRIWSLTTPDNVIIPTGAGSNILGCDIGFSELLRRGEIASLPRLFAAQPENCAPLHASFKAGSNDLVPVEVRPTIADGASIAKPVRAREVLAAVRRSGGATVTVSEAEIEDALFGSAGSASMWSRPQPSPPPRSQSSWNAKSSSHKRPCSC